MKISCPSCSAKYSIADEKVDNRLAKIRCRKCGTTIVVDGKVSPPSVTTADAASAPAAADSDSGAAAADDGTTYSVDFADNGQRSMTAAELVRAHKAGEVTAETYVWKDGFDDWKPMGEVPELVQAFHASSSPSAASAPAVTGSSPLASGAAAQRVAASPAAAPDLFGRVDKAGSEEDVTTSAPQDQPPQEAGPIGARGESSVLFSLSALTSSAPSNPPPAGADATTATKDDSGLIDLKAMAATPDGPGADGAAAVGQVGALGMTAPLGMAAPLGGAVPSVISTTDIQPLPKSRSGVYIVLGMVAAAVIIAGAILVTQEEEKVAPQPASTLPTALATSRPTAADEDDEEAKPPATGTAAEDEGKKKEYTPAQKAAWARAARRKKAAQQEGSSSGTSTGTSAVKKKKKKKGGKCGCAPGDLRCAMRCAAGG